MKNLKKICLLFFCVTLLYSCSKDEELSNLRHQLMGKWQAVSYGGGFAGLPETEIEDNIRVEFTLYTYKFFKDNVLTFQAPYHINYTEYDGERYYFIDLDADTLNLDFSFLDTAELILAPYAFDASYTKYSKITN